MSIMHTEIDDAMNLIKEELAADMTRLLELTKEESAEAKDSSVYIH